jgi:hypothetical protein
LDVVVRPADEVPSYEFQLWLRRKGGGRGGEGGIGGGLLEGVELSGAGTAVMGGAARLGLGWPESAATETDSGDDDGVVQRGDWLGVLRYP